MKTFLQSALLMGGLVLVAFGNSWGLLGMVPAFIQMLVLDIKEEIKSF